MDGGLRGGGYFQNTCSWVHCWVVVRCCWVVRWASVVHCCSSVHCCSWIWSTMFLHSCSVWVAHCSLGTCLGTAWYSSTGRVLHQPGVADSLGDGVTGLAGHCVVLHMVLGGHGNSVVGGHTTVSVAMAMAITVAIQPLAFPGLGISLGLGLSQGVGGNKGQPENKPS